MKRAVFGNRAVSEKSKERLNAEVRRKQLVAAARRTLASHGPSQFGVVAVAKEAGVAVGLISRYFGGINELLSALLIEVVANRADATQQPIDSEDHAIQALVGILETHFDAKYYSRANLMVWIPIIENATMGKEIRAAILENDEQEIRMLASIFRVIATAKEKHIDSDMLARMFFALLDGLWLRWCYSGAEDFVAERSMAAEFLNCHLNIQV